MKHLIVKSKEFLRIEIAYKEWLQTIGYSKNIVETLPSNIRELFYYLESESITSIKKIQSNHLIEYFEILSKRKNIRLGGGLSQSHLNKHLYGLKTFCKYLQKTHGITLNIEIQGARLERKIKVILTKKEINKILQECEYNSVGLRDRAMLAVYYGCGLRLNEGVNLKLEDVLLSKQLLYVRKGKNYQERYVPMNDHLTVLIRDYINYGRPILLREKENNMDNPYLFINQRGKRVEGQVFYKRLKLLQKKTNDSTLMKKEIGLHTLRHSIATHLLQTGMRLEDIKDFLGHKSIESTQIYTHLLNENL